MTAPFRHEDLESRILRLREERDELTRDIAQARAELRALRPWSYRRFLLGAALPPLALVAMLLVSSLATLVLR